MSGVTSSTGLRTRVDADAVLFAGLRSNELDTVAVLVIVTSGTNGVAVIVIVAVAPTARLPTAQVMLPKHVPWLGVGVASVTCDGSESITVTRSRGPGRGS